MNANAKPKLAIYWAASCGGCEIAILGINEKIVEVDKAFELVFCPCLMDTKVEQVASWEDDSIDVCLFNGAIRSSEHAYMAQLLRRKSKVLVAFGACAQQGGIPGLANATTRQAILDTVYKTGVSTENDEGVMPQPTSTVDGKELRLPVFYERVHTLAQAVKVDYTLPGCPPEPENIWDNLVNVLEGNIPAPGSVAGAESTVCDYCKRHRSEKKIQRFYRTWEIIPDEETCLLDQGLPCAGIATRAGCGALCPQVNSPCIGCYGPPEGVSDYGARLGAAWASVIDSDDPVEIARIIDEGIPDPVGALYRFSLPDSFLQVCAKRK